MSIRPSLGPLWPTDPCYELSAVHPDDAARLGRELGIPAAREVLVLIVWHPRGWRDHCFHLIGTYATSDDPPEAPRFWLHSPTGELPRKEYKALDTHTYPEFPGEVIAWRRCVLTKDSPLWIEARWHPETGDTLSLHGMDYRTTIESITAAWRGRTLLKYMERRGRPRGPAPSTESEKAELKAKMQESYQHLTAKGIKPTAENIARALHKDPRVFRRQRNQRFNLPLPRKPE